MRNKQHGVKSRSSFGQFLEEAESEDEERSVDELAADGDVGAIKEQFGSRSARTRRKKRQISDRNEADNARRLERAKRSRGGDDDSNDGDNGDGDGDGGGGGGGGDDDGDGDAHGDQVGNDGADGDAAASAAAVPVAATVPTSKHVMPVIEDSDED